MLITFAFSVREYEEQEGKLIKVQNIWVEERDSICPGLSTTKLRFWVTEVKSQQRPSPIQPLASDTHGSPEQKDQLLQRTGAGKAVSDFLALFF